MNDENGRYLMHFKPDEKTGKWLAIITFGTPGGAFVTVCAVEDHNSEAECKTWFEEQMKLRPWLNAEGEFEITEVPTMQ